MALPPSRPPDSSMLCCCRSRFREDLSETSACTFARLARRP